MIDPRLPLMIRQPNVLAALDAGTAAAGNQANVLRQAEGQNLFRQHGAGAMRGDSAAMNALAGFDPVMAQNMRAGQLDMQATRQEMDLTQMRMDDVRRQAKEAARAQQDAAAAAAELQQARMLMTQAGQAFLRGDKIAFGKVAAEFDVPDLPMNEQGLKFLDAIVSGFDEGVAGIVPVAPEPTADMRNLEWRAAEGGLQRGTPEYQEFMRTGGGNNGPLVDMSGLTIGGEGPGGGGAIFPESNPNIPDGSGRNAFGLSGAAGGLANRVSDFFTGTEVAPEIGENTRFFRNLEEDMLVNLSQAYGRQPAQQLMERLRTLLPNVGTTEGAQAAYRELEIMRNRFERDLRVAESRMTRAGRMTDTQITELERQILSLQASMAQMDEGIRRLAPAGTGTTVTPEDEALINKWLAP